MYPYHVPMVLADQHVQQMVTSAEHRRHGPEAGIGPVDRKPAAGPMRCAT